VGDWASDATWVKDLHSSLVPLVKDARYVGVETMLWTSDVVKDPWFPLVKDPSEVCPSVLLPPKSIYATM
jgi:hypothetical protein